jgi:Ca2+/Na+ antiporter
MYGTDTGLLIVAIVFGLLIFGGYAFTTLVIAAVAVVMALFFLGFDTSTVTPGIAAFVIIAGFVIVIVRLNKRKKQEEVKGEKRQAEEREREQRLAAWLKREAEQWPEPKPMTEKAFQEMIKASQEEAERKRRRGNSVINFIVVAIVVVIVFITLLIAGLFRGPGL